jgi:hypothetical protein
VTGGLSELFSYDFINFLWSILWSWFRCTSIGYDLWTVKINGRMFYPFFFEDFSTINVKASKWAHIRRQSAPCWLQRRLPRPAQMAMQDTGPPVSISCVEREQLREAVSSSAARPRPISISPTFTGQRRRTLASPAAVTLCSPWLAEASLSLPSPALTLPWYPALPRTANLTPWSTVTCPRPGAGDRSHGPLAPEQGISNLMASC